jgi:hypothetical protein
MNILLLAVYIRILQRDGFRLAGWTGANLLPVRIPSRVYGQPKKAA